MANFGDANINGSKDPKMQRKHNYLIELLNRAWQRIWTMDNHGSGSGLDADKLDSLDSTDFARANMAILPSTNLDSYTTQGLYYCRTTAIAVTLSNTPIAAASMEAFSLFVERHAGYRQTLAFYSPTDFSLFVRNYYSGSWGSWARLVNADGKLTNADTVDGEQAADIVTGARINAKISQTFTLADDEATSFTPASPFGMLILFGTLVGSTDANCQVNFRCTATANFCVSMILPATVEVTTGALAGTTGTDTKITVSAHTDGKIYIENRRGASRSLGIVFLGLA